MKIQYFAVLAIAALVFVSCKKDKEAPVITFEEPAETDMFSVGDTIHFHGMVSDNEGMHEVHVTLVNTSDNDAELWSTGGHVHDNPYHYEGDYVVTVAAGSVLELHVEATDENGNTTEEHQHITIN